MTPHLAGGLAKHARGRTLTASFAAVACDQLPKSGAVFVLGKELQANDEQASAWLAWATAPGRVLVAVPPFGRQACELPTHWQVPRAEALAGGETALGKLLARERRHEVRGQFLPLERTAGQVVTAGWRKHPAAGLVVITTLPVWSLTALDHSAACETWLAELLDQAGTPVTPAADDESGTRPPERAPTQDEWAVLLHLCTGPFDDDDSAMRELSRSTVHDLTKECAAEALHGLREQGLAEAGAPTAAGEQALLAGPYSAFARALRRQA